MVLVVNVQLCDKLLYQTTLNFMRMSLLNLSPETSRPDGVKIKVLKTCADQLRIMNHVYNYIKLYIYIYIYIYI